MTEKQIITDLVKLAREAASQGSNGFLYKFDYNFSRLLDEHEYGYYNTDENIEFYVNERFNKKVHKNLEIDEKEDDRIKRRQLKRIESNHFKRPDDKALIGGTSFQKIKDYCKDNAIPQFLKHENYVLYAVVGAYISYAFKIIDQEDVDYAIKLSKTEGCLGWICASIESAKEFDLS